MMKLFIVILTFVFLNSITMPQNKAALNIGLGYYADNSENSLKLMHGEKYRSYFQLGFTYQRENIFGNDFQFAYDFHKNTKDHLLTFVTIDENTGNVANEFFGDVSLIMHNFDLSYTRKMNRSFTWGVGPSFAIVNRIIDVPNHLYDKVASSALGASAFLEFTFPLNSAVGNFYFTSNMKFRYLHSIWFDKGNRNLDDYSQWFLTSELTVGIGYAF